LTTILGLAVIWAKRQLQGDKRVDGKFSASGSVLKSVLDLEIAIFVA